MPALVQCDLVYNAYDASDNNASEIESEEK